MKRVRPEVSHTMTFQNTEWRTPKAFICERQVTYNIKKSKWHQIYHHWALDDIG